MTTIISPSTANSDLINGVFHNGVNFINKYNDILKNTWVVFCYWSNQNSFYGCEVADLRTEYFCNTYNIPNKKW